MWASPRAFSNSPVPPVTIPTVGLGNTGEASTESLPRLDRLKIPTHTATWSKFCVHAMWRSPIGVPAGVVSVLANSSRSPGEGPGAPRSSYCCRGGLWITTRVSPKRLAGDADVLPTPIVVTIALAQATVPTVMMSFRRISPPFLVLELRDGQLMDHRLAESWGNVGSVPLRRLRATWPLMLLGSWPRRVPSRSHHVDRRISRYRSWVTVEGLVPSWSARRTRQRSNARSASARLPAWQWARISNR